MRQPAVMLVMFAVLGGCKGADKSREQAPPPPPGPTRVAVVDSLQTPESVVWDSAQDVYFVSNINGNPSAKDGNGFISRIKPEGSVDSLKFIEGGRNRVVLNAPKGMTLRGDTLWVTDIDAVRAFSATTGAPVATVDLSRQGAVFLNDPAVGPDGTLYITDTGIRFDEQGGMQHPGPDRIFRIAAGRGRVVSIASQGDTLQRPNGITWDRSGVRFILVPFGGRAVFSWKPGDSAPFAIAMGPGGFDGVEVARGRVLVSSWNDSTVSSYETGSEVKLISGVPSPADIGYDARRNRVLIPVFTANRLEIWQLP